MTHHMSHGEYLLKQKTRVVEIADEMLAEQLGVIEGSRLLAGLKSEVSDDQFDPDFNIFVAIASDTDALPVGKERADWADYALVSKDNEIKSVEEFYREDAFAGCRRLVQRFGRDAQWIKDVTLH